MAEYNIIPYTANISSRKNFMVFEVNSQIILSLKVAAAPSLPSHS